MNILHGLGQLLNVLKSIRVEQVELTLPEDACQVLIELLVDLPDLLLGLLLVALLHKLIDVVACLVSISPFLKNQRQLKLLLPKCKDLRHLHIIIKPDGIRDLLVGLSGCLIHFDDLVEVVVQRLRDLLELTLVLVFVTELEDFPRGVVVEVKELAVLPECIKNVLEGVNEEINARHDLALLFDDVQVGVRHQDQVVR